MPLRHKTICAVLVLWAAVSTAQAAEQFFWYECPLAAKINEITLAGSETVPQVTLSMEVLFVTFKRGFMGDRKRRCGFDKGDTLTLRNYLTDKENQTAQKENRTWIRTIKISKESLVLLHPGDRVKILYSHFNNDKEQKEIWDFVHIHRRRTAAPPVQPDRNTPKKEGKTKKIGTFTDARTPQP